MQANNLFIQNNIRKDHFFNDANPNNEGHHQFVQLIDQAGDPALAAGMAAVSYSKATGGAGSNQPFWRNSTNVRQIPTLRTGTTAVVPGVNVLVDLNAQPGTNGIIQMFGVGATAYKGVAYVIWNGVSTSVLQLGVDGVGITAITSSTTVVRVTTTFAGNVQWALYTLPN
jgi:hypothetical protein